ncbi:cytochrome P450 (plasmid) [Amycolatopsis sp. AA4]|uniref:cytochrome P450 n=1 Tax=Actinomycetes TaxID=1760 RepID=UPI0001B556DA|nr:MULTISPECIES: cytochrome P450 [Actinomycetes]ATY17037.1 cytochrome P450 [Amycolatopsis sp. AA4]EFL12471.1 CvhE protein [Streptomyces sp. AA4]
MTDPLAPPKVPLDQLTGLRPLTDTTVCVDPQAAYAALRARWDGLPIAPVALADGVPAWLVMDYEHVRTVSRDDVRFARNPAQWRQYAEGGVPADSGLAPMMFPRDNAYFADGERHARLRAPLVQGLAGLSEPRMARIVRATCERLLARLPDTGEADLVAGYARQVPMLTVAGLFGIDPDLSEDLQRCLIALFGSGEDSQAGNAELEDILARVLAEHRARPGEDDLTTAFLAHPNLRGDAEIVQSMVLMMSAGWETTTVWIGHTLRILLTDERFAARVRGGRLGIDHALDEVLWLDPPMCNMPARYALCDTVIGGRHIAKGDPLILAFAAANADPQIRRDGEDWPAVGNRAHFAWGVGHHACPAQRAGRLIARTAVETALHQLPDARLAIEPRRITLQPSPWTRGPAHLPVLATRTADRQEPGHAA